jgi:hypothetical protein
MGYKFNPDFKRGAIVAADIAATYNSSTTHPYRLDDCILAKMNIIGRQKPRRNKVALRTPDLLLNAAWMIGFATALAEMHRLLIGGNDSAGTRKVASACGLTLAVARAVGVSSYDLKELRKAGIR